MSAGLVLIGLVKVLIWRVGTETCCSGLLLFNPGQLVESAFT